MNTRWANCPELNITTQRILGNPGVFLPLLLETLLSPVLSKACTGPLDPPDLMPYGKRAWLGVGNVKRPGAHCRAETAFGFSIKAGARWRALWRGQCSLEGPTPGSQHPHSPRSYLSSSCPRTLLSQWPCLWASLPLQAGVKC